MNSIFFYGRPNVNVPLWFLLTLFLVKYLVNIFVSKGIKPIVVLLLSFLIAIIINLLKINLGNPLFLREPEYLFNTVTGICFFCCGIVFKEIQFNRLLVLVCLSLHLIIILGYFSYVDMEHNTLIKGYYLLWIISSLTGIILINNCFHYLCKTMKFKLFNYVGYNSMTFYLVHFIIIKIILYYVAPILPITSSWTLFMVMLLACIVCIPVFVVIFNREKMYWIIGK